MTTTETRPYLPCSEILTFLAAFIHRELPPETLAEFERHLGVCDSCVEYLATYQETIRIARATRQAPQLTVEQVPEDLVTAILSVTTRKG